MKHWIVGLGLSLLLACSVDDVTTDPGSGMHDDDGAGGSSSSLSTSSSSSSNTSSSSSTSSTSSSSGMGGGSATSGAGGGNAATSGEVSFLCYNVHGLPSVITGDNTAGRMAAIAPLLNDFDVVALQEDFDVANHGTLVNASTHNSHQWFDAKVDPARVYGAGLSVFGVPPQIDQHEEHYDACNGIFDASSDCLSSKGFQMVRLQLSSGAEVDVYNTHLDAGGGSADDNARADQVDQLLASLNTVSANRAVVVMGDLNLEEDDPNEAPTLAYLFEGGGLLDACDEMMCGEPGRIERIMYRGSDSLALTVQSWVNEPAFENGGDPLSDHPAISASFAWETLSP